MTEDREPAYIVGDIEGQPLRNRVVACGHASNFSTPADAMNAVRLANVAYKQGRSDSMRNLMISHSGHIEIEGFDRLVKPVVVRPQCEAWTQPRWYSPTGHRCWNKAKYAAADGKLYCGTHAKMIARKAKPSDAIVHEDGSVTRVGGGFSCPHCGYRHPPDGVCV